MDRGWGQGRGETPQFTGMDRSEPSLERLAGAKGHSSNIKFYHKNNINLDHQLLIYESGDRQAMNRKLAEGQQVTAAQRDISLWHTMSLNLRGLTCPITFWVFGCFR